MSSPAPSMSRGYLEDEESNVRERVFYDHLQNSPTTSTFPNTPTDRFPRRKSLSQPQDAQPLARGMKRSKNPPPLPPLDTRSRSNSKSNGNGKEPMGSPSLTDHVSNFDRYYGYRQNGTSSSGPVQGVSPGGMPSTADGSTANGGTRRRGSLLVAATDAFNTKFGRRRASIRQAPIPVVLPDVIDIRPPLPDEEEHERSRLRYEAAQAIGLGSYIISRETQPREDSATDEDEDGRHLQAVNTGAWGHGLRNPDTSALVGSRSRFHGSSVSVTIPVQQPPPTHIGRFRAGSVQSRSNSARAMPSTPIPPFPSTIAALTLFTQSTGEFPKYYPPSTLRIFALSKSWKSRYIVLSVPTNLVTRNRTPAVSYLHLFKTSNPEENEIERLEINEDSVVFVSEDEVGGRRQVIKVGGADVGALKKEYIHGEGGHAMWLLQMKDQEVAHLWISNIKNVILGQRTVRAGLMPHSFGNHEPRGDMDVMLSIRAQGLVTSSTSPTSTTFRLNDTSSSIPLQQVGSDPNYASSISSQSARSQATVPRTSPANAVSVLKGLFSTGRPRSSSRATSINSDRQLEATEGSFASIGNSLLGRLRSNTPDAQSINTVNTVPTMRINMPIAEPVTPITPIQHRLDRPIVAKPQSILWSASEPIRSTSPNMTMTRQAPPPGPDEPPSLQPPPRKRWTSSTFDNQTTDHAQPALSSPNTPTAESSRRISFSASVTSKEPPQPLTGFSFGSPQQTRAASLKSVSTYASADKASNVDKSSVSTKRSSGVRRWSRQSMLPSRSNPPADPPPAIPHPYANDQQSGHGSSPSSHKSFVSALPKFAKRQSGSSVQSFTSFSTTHSQPGSALTLAHPRASTSSRNSMPPPPLPAPTSALPPAPTDSHHDSRDDMLKSAAPSRSSSMKSNNIRHSVGTRNFRNSMIAPKPPPSVNLPPRPDQPEYKAHHRRTLSGDGAISPSRLDSIPASPVAPPKVVSPFPPPDSPLPPTPSTSPPEVMSHPPVRTSSLKHRLRNLSAPSSSSNKFSGKINLGYPSSNPSNSGDTLSASFLSTSTPPTPIAEKIATFTDADLNLHPSFLQMHTPVMPSMTLNPAEFHVDPPPEEESIAFTELPPPPRRGSKQILDMEVLSSFGAAIHKVPEPQPLTPVHTVPNHLSLSRPGSAMSHRSEKAEPASELDWNVSKDESEEEVDDEVSPIESNSHAERPHFSLSRPASFV